MTKNSLGDLNDHLFAQIERLGDEGLSPEDIEREAKRAEALVSVADKITDIAKTSLSAAKLYAEHGDRVLGHLPRIGKTEPSGK